MTAPKDVDCTPEDNVVSQHRWLCCRSLRRTPFCHDCGAKRPEVGTSSEAETLAYEFQAESEKCFRTADTFMAKAESIRVEEVLSEHVNGDPYETWGDVVRSREASADAWRKRGNKFARYERILRELIEKSSG